MILPWTTRLVARSFAAAGVPVTTQPAYRVVEDGREATGRSDTRPVAERQVVVLGRHCDLPSGRVLRQAGAREAGAAAEVAASRKQDKYADRDSRYLFESVAVETLAVLNSSADSLLKETGNKISLNTGESRESVSYTSASRCLSGVSMPFCSLPSIHCAD